MEQRRYRLRPQSDKFNIGAIYIYTYISAVHLRPTCYTVTRLHILPSRTDVYVIADNAPVISFS